MPWKLTKKTDTRRAFVEACWERKTSLAEVCRSFGISRQCGYKWLHRAQQVGWATKGRFGDRSHRPHGAEQLQQRWWRRVMAVRRQHPFSGADQLRWYLEQRYPLGPWHGPRTIGRWLRAAGLTRKRRRRALPGPQIERERRIARQPNDQWTIDFKGWFYSGDRQRVGPLTVRDAATGFVLMVRDLKRTSEGPVRKVLARLFCRYGLPRAIRTDNGPPFGGDGPRGWSSLAVWWVQLGIAVEYGRPGCPQDNAAHEQMHQILQQQTAKPAAPTRSAQQRRFDRWRVRYNYHRPHQTLGMRPPASLYRPSPTRLRRHNWTYSTHCELKRTDPRGRIRWRHRPRQIGRAFARQTVALKPVAADIVAVYFGPHLLGELHAADHTGIRAVRIQTPAERGG